MPQTRKGHTSKGKNGSKPIHNGNDQISPSAEDSSEQTQQFQLELYWCIRQLEAVLHTDKMTPRQAQDASRALNVLKSKTAPLIKKRQVMRTTFGDYRVKMSEEEKQFNKTKTQLRLAAVEPDKKSHFFKKCSSLSSSTTTNAKEEEMDNCDETKCTETSEDRKKLYEALNGSCFRFNFE
ncbi:UPF0488 protein CG14286-like isoform X5 [Schistocerca nitens]|uniref:UPF0488 protein CG14286-like isoform X5 n=1 Tax=Schistocerca nitens TaxID=7011 RepID=UPI002117BCE7|nr:UPF0488 protein CG14286-like isoform X5 [Schistocerca nitens]